MIKETTPNIQKKYKNIKESSYKFEKWKRDRTTPK